MMFFKKRLLLFVVIFGAVIVFVFGLAYHQMNKAGRESCKVSLESFLVKEMENPQTKNSIPINEEWRTITNEEKQILLTKAVESEKLDCNNIRYNYGEGHYWGEEFVISMRIVKSTKKIEIKINE